MSIETAKLRELLLELSDPDGHTISEVCDTIERIESRLAKLDELEAAFNDWQFDLADGSDQRYQARVHAVLKSTGCQSPEWLVAPNGTVYPNPGTETAAE